MRRWGVFSILVGAAASVPGSSAVAQDAAAGKQIFRQCAACHSQSGEAGVGPTLKGVVGRKVGSVEGFRYSDAMTSASYAWDARSLDGFLASPSTAIPGNRMPFPGVSTAKERADLIAFLQTLR